MQRRRAGCWRSPHHQGTGRMGALSSWRTVCPGSDSGCSRMCCALDIKRRGRVGSPRPRQLPTGEGRWRSRASWGAGPLSARLRQRPLTEGDGVSMESGQAGEYGQVGQCSGGHGCAIRTKTPAFISAGSLPHRSRRVIASCRLPDMHQCRFQRGLCLGHQPALAGVQGLDREFLQPHLPFSADLRLRGLQA